MNDPLFRPVRRLLLKGAVAGTLAAATHAQAQSDAAKPGAKSAAAGTAKGISPLMRTVSAYIAQAAQQPLPDAVTAETRHHLLDTLAAMVSGSRLLPGEKAIAYVKALGGTREACVPGTRIVTNVVNAALAGGMLAHADETDDSHEASLTHPGCGLIPAALAMAQRERAGGTALLRAIALGYDICTRLSVSLGAYEFFAAGHSTHAFGPTFGAAAACASLARFDADQVRHMLSFTAQQASGVSYQQRDVQHIEKSFDLGGMPSRNGATAATMIAAGMTGVDDAFSGERNFFFAYGPKNDPEALVRDLGTRFEIVNTSVKKWSVGSPIQAPLDSLSDLMKAHKVQAADVEKVVIRLSHQGANVVSNRNVPDICMQHLAALMLIDGTVTFVSAHDEERMHDPKVLEVRRRVELYGSDELDRAMPNRQGIVELTLRDGRELSHHTRDVRGTPRNPMTREEIGEKAAQLMIPVLGKKRTHELIATVWGIEQMKDARVLRRLLMA